MKHNTSAWPLALIYAALVVYASLYPFSDWRDQGVVPWAFLTSAWSRYWTGFDVAVNVAGYLPLGFLWALSALRSGRAHYALVCAIGVAALLSLSLEAIQGFLPARVPSQLDLLMNVVGAGLGALLAWSLERLGVIGRWDRFRARWFVAQARGGLVLLALWPLALLFPAAVPLGLGQIMERMETALAHVLEGTPLLKWLPVREIELQPLLPATELLCVALGLVIPCLLGFCIIQATWRRLLFVLNVLGVGLMVTALSAALSYGPDHAWAWLGLPAQVGLASGLACALALLRVPARVSAALLLVLLGIYLSLLNHVPTSPYFAHTLSAWEQGRFIRFNGLAQWLGWLWPYAALGYALHLVWQRSPEN